MTHTKLDYPATLSHLMSRRGERVTVTLATEAVDQQSPLLAAQISGTLQAAWDDAVTTEDGVGAPVMFSFDEHDSAFQIDPSAFRGADSIGDVLTVDLGAATLEVSAHVDTAATGQRQRGHRRLPRLQGPLRLIEGREEGGTTAGAAESGRSLRIRTVRWVLDNAGKSMIAALVMGTATVLVVYPKTNPQPPECQPQVAANGALSQYAGTRIVRRRGVRDTFVVKDGVFHHIPDGITYVRNASCFPAQFDVGDAELRRQRRKDGPDAAGSPPGTRPRIGPELVRDGYLLREEGGKASWLIVGGERVPIATERTFACLAKRYLVWDFVGKRVVARFHRHPSLRRARCPRRA
jgi:hypothetical protein